MSGATTNAACLPKRHDGSRRPEVCSATYRHRHCDGCGFPVSPIESFCGECICEEDSQ